MTEAKKKEDIALFYLKDSILNMISDYNNRLYRLEKSRKRIIWATASGKFGTLSSEAKSFILKEIDYDDPRAGINA